MSKRGKIRRSSYKGLTLAEMLIAIFIFGIIILAIMGVTASYLQGKSSLKKEQQDMEEITLAINYLGKKIRMSNMDSCPAPGCGVFDAGKTLRIKDNNTTHVMAYQFVVVGAVNQLQETDVNTGTTRILASDMEGGFGTNGANPALIAIGVFKTGRYDQTITRTAVSQRAGYLQP